MPTCQFQADNRPQSYKHKHKNCVIREYEQPASCLLHLRLIRRWHFTGLSSHHLQEKLMVPFCAQNREKLSHIWGWWREGDLTTCKVEKRRWALFQRGKRQWVVSQENTEGSSSSLALTRGNKCRSLMSDWPLTNVCLCPHLSTLIHNCLV